MRLIDADKIIFREIDEIGGEYEPYLGCSKSQIDSLPSVTPQLSSELEKNSKKLEKDFGELVEIDLYSVIKQKYIEREVLEKIRAEIDKAWCIKPKNRYEEGLKDQALKDMQIIDRYKAESEE